MYGCNRLINTTLKAAVLIVAVALCTVGASAQLQVGENVKMNLSGNLGFGYTGSFGNDAFSSSHGDGLNGDANLTGYYFHPNFLSFDVRPYYERSQTNADSQTISRGTGLGGSLNFFGGSHFPGSISYGRDFSSNSIFQVAGIPSVAGNSTSRNFGISWSALLPNLPTLQVSYATGSGSSSVDGFPGENNNSTRTFALNSNYRLVGFDLQGYYSQYKSRFDSSGLITATDFSTEGSGKSYGVSTHHSLPLHGGFGIGWGRSSNESDNGTSWNSDSYTATASIMPWRRLSLSESVNYSTNLSGTLLQAFQDNGSTVPLRFATDSNSLFMGTTATVSIGHGFGLSGHVNYRQQSFAGRDFSDTQYGGTINYNYRSPLFGFLYFGLGVVDTASDSGNDGLGLVANVSTSRKFGHWDTSADFNYSQNVQTLIVIATTSSYSYGGNLRRRINRDTHWSASFRGSHSGLTTQEGSGSRAESYNSGFSWKKYSIAGSYSQSSGTAVFTNTGSLTATPIGSLITDDFLLFNARSYAVNGSALFFRRLSLTASYAKFTSNTSQLGVGVSNSGDRYNSRVEYRLRKFSIIGGFARSNQEISTLQAPPRVVNSYFLSLSRWFNVF